MSPERPSWSLAACTADCDYFKGAAALISSAPLAKHCSQGGSKHWQCQRQCTGHRDWQLCRFCSSLLRLPVKAFDSSIHSSNLGEDGTGCRSVLEISVMLRHLTF